MSTWLRLTIAAMILLGAVAFGYILLAWGAPKYIDEPVITEYEERLIHLDRESIEEAYKEQVRHIFQVWMKDETGQPGRAVVGVEQARKAYVGSMNAIKVREEKLRRQ